jgi:hypothetical protein
MRSFIKINFRVRVLCVTVNWLSDEPNGMLWCYQCVRNKLSEITQFEGLAINVERDCIMIPH